MPTHSRRGPRRRSRRLAQRLDWLPSRTGLVDRWMLSATTPRSARVVFDDGRRLDACSSRRKPRARISPGPRIWCNARVDQLQPRRFGAPGISRVAPVTRLTSWSTSSVRRHPCGGQPTPRADQLVGLHLAIEGRAAPRPRHANRELRLARRDVEDDLRIKWAMTVRTKASGQRVQAVPLLHEIPGATSLSSVRPGPSACSFAVSSCICAADMSGCTPCISRPTASSCSAFSFSSS